MILKETKYSYNDLTIVPAIISEIKSRKEVNPFHGDNLPLFTAPMSAVINEENWVNYENNKINPIIPRTVNIEKRIEFLKEGKWVAFSLEEAKSHFIGPIPNYKNIGKFRICVDIANGHMKDLISTCKTIKIYYPDCEIMTGNIANPETIKEYMEADIDYVRVGIGGGSGCFVCGTKITMEDNSFKNIEDISIGDKVKTIDGSIQTVVDLTRYISTEKLIKINDEITSTENHKFFVIDKIDKHKVNESNLEKYGYWLEASKLNPNKHLLIKRV